MIKLKNERFGWHLQWLVGWICISFFAPLPAAFLGQPDRWYAKLVKPAVVPPGWVFSVVWSFLYLMMGVAAYLVWASETGGNKKRTAIVFFCIQLVINAAWSPVFFGLNSLYGGLFLLVLLILIVGITTGLFWNISRLAGSIFFLYLLWLFFAFYLNFSLITLN